MGSAVSVHVQGNHTLKRERKNNLNDVSACTIVNTQPIDSLGDEDKPIIYDSSTGSLSISSESTKDVDDYFQSELTSFSTDVTLRTFRYKKLRKMTNYFAEENILGKGGFGTVYKGWLQLQNSPSPSPVAIKKLHKESVQGHREWLAEIVTLGRIRHDNLVNLYGYCSENDNILLVYEFLPMGSLKKLLFPEDEQGHPPPSTLSLKMRLKIALDMAEVLAYLHDRRIVHRDFKSSNILLDEKLNAKLSDFGLATIVDSISTNSTSRMMGTLGYLDPQFFVTGRLGFKSDVYSYGVTLLEMLTGKRALDKISKQPLTEWSKPYLNSEPPNIDVLMDSTMKVELEPKVTYKVILTITWIIKYCLAENVKERPNMSEVAAAIHNLLQNF